MSVDWKKGLAGLLLLLVAPLAAGQDEPIYIESDRLDIDDTKGVSIYRGNVHFSQGDTHFWADEVTVQQEQKQIVYVVAEGKPARFHQRPKEGSGVVEGEAERIEYDASHSLLVLEGNARLEQAQNAFYGNRIEYEAAKKVVRAGKMGERSQGRVQMTIIPESEPAAPPSGPGEGE